MAPAVRNADEMGGDFAAAELLTIPWIVADGGVPGPDGAKGPFPPSSHPLITEIVNRPAIHESLLILPMQTSPVRWNAMFVPLKSNSTRDFR
jgi:hypothetical protein